MNVEQFPDRIIKIENQNFLYFGGTSYLGLPSNKAFQKLLIQNIKKWGTSYGSSRNANIQLLAYENCEKYLAKYIQSQAAVTVSSGTLAGKLVIEQLIIDKNIFFHLPNNHNAIQKLGSLPVFIDGKLNKRLLDSKIEKITILTDAVPTSEVKPIDLSFTDEISITKKITLVIDESHSFGILGNNGCGLFANISCKNIKNIIMISSLGKAYGVTGGVIAGNLDFINTIKSIPNYVSAAGMNPAFAQTIPDAADIYLKQFEKLKQNLKFIHTNLKESSLIDFDVNYPILYPKQEKINEILNENNIVITNFKYPNDLGYLNRIVITANHTKSDLKKLISILNRSY